MGTNTPDNNGPAPERERDEVAEMLGALGRIEAPRDFDLRVRARIAQGRPSTTGFGLPVMVRYGVPLVLMLGVAGVAGYYYTSLDTIAPLQADSRQSFDTQVEKQPQTAIPVPDSNGTVIPTNEMASDTGNIQKRPKLTTRSSDSQVMIDNNSVEDPDRGGGSLDFGLGRPRQIDPRGINLSKTPTVTNSIPTGSISVREILTNLGIHATAAANGWFVNSVDESSSAGRSDVRVADIVSAIEGRPIRANTEFRGTVTVRSLQVIRDGRTVNITLR